MKLSNASIKKLIKGACYHEERDGYLYSYHYTQNVGGSVANFTLPDGEKHICIYFPSWGEVGIKALTINGKYKSVKKKQTKLLALGDSITQGYGAFWAGAGYINIFSRLYGCDLLGAERLSRHSALSMKISRWLTALP